MPEDKLLDNIRYQKLIYAKTSKPYKRQKIEEIIEVVEDEGDN